MWAVFNVTTTQVLDFANFSVFKKTLEGGLPKSFVVLSVSYCYQNPTEENDIKCVGIPCRH
jgi:hypothetical protein